MSRFKEFKDIVNSYFSADGTTLLSFLISEIVSRDDYGLAFFKHNYDVEIKSIYDFGSNIGVYSSFASFLYPGAKVYSIEGNPEVFERLKSNVKIFENVIPINMVLYPEKKKISFTPLVSNTNDVRQSSLCGRVAGDGDIETSSFSDFLNSPLVKVEKPYIVKFDIEGGESEILFTEEGVEFLRNADLVSFEVHFGKKFLVMDKEEYLSVLRSIDGFKMTLTSEGRGYATGNLVKIY